MTWWWWLITYIYMKVKRQKSRGFPGGSVVKNLPATFRHGSNQTWVCSLVQEHGHEHAVERLNLCTTRLLSLYSRAWKLQLLKPWAPEPMVHHKRSLHDEKAIHHNEEQPLFASTKERPTQQWRPSTAKN